MRHNLLAPYQVNDDLMAVAGPQAIFMHCLPAASRRGGDGRGDRRAAIRRLRRGGKPPACAEGRAGLVHGSHLSVNEADFRVRSRTSVLTIIVLPFVVEPLDRRGRVVRLGPAIDRILPRHAYPRAGRAARRRGDGADRAARLDAEVRGPLPAADAHRRRRRHDRRRFRRARPRARLRPLRRRSAAGAGRQAAKPRRRNCSARAISPSPSTRAPTCRATRASCRSKGRGSRRPRINISASPSRSRRWCGSRWPRA